MTRAELVTALGQGRVVVDRVSRDRVHVAVDHGGATTTEWVDETWMRCERGRKAIERWGDADSRPPVSPTSVPSKPILARDLPPGGRVKGRRENHGNFPDAHPVVSRARADGRHAP